LGNIFPVAGTYEPDSFLKLLNSSLSQNRSKPLFFSVHLCLPHTPYSWASTLLIEDDPLQNYLLTIKRVDQQFNDLMQLLKKNKLLDHSIVVLLSDHGEALELSGDRITEANLFISGENNPQNTIPAFYPYHLENEEINKSVGHGTDVLSLTQHHNVLAFQLFGLDKNIDQTFIDRVSLLDIKPTVLSLIGIHDSHHDGVSLKELILGEAKTLGNEAHFFVESDFSPPSIYTAHPELRKVLFEGIEYFQLDPVTARFTVKPSMEKLINSSKQFADFYGSWVLALYPQNQTQMMAILVNSETGQWTNDLNTTFAKESPVAQMLSALKKFYGNDITQII